MYETDLLKYNLCDELRINNANVVYNYEYNNVDCNTILNNRSLIECLFDETTDTNNTNCTYLIADQLYKHENVKSDALSLADIVLDDPSTNSNQDYPTDWIPLC